MHDVLIKLAYDVLAVVVPALVTMGIEYLRRKLGNERLAKLQRELATKKELTNLAILFAQHFYAELDGSGRYAIASEWLARELTARGILVTDQEIRGLIEAALKAAKLEFGEQWKQTTTAPEPV